MKIEIETSDVCGWTVSCEDRWEENLKWDEALGVVAALLISPEKAEYLLTQDQHNARDAKMRDRLHEEAADRSEF